MQMMIGLLIASLVVGLLLYLYWLSLRNQQAMILERTRLAAIVESSNDAIIGNTTDGVITDRNRAAENMFGYTAQTVIGRTITSLIVPEELQAEEVDILARIMCGEKVPHFQTRRQRSDGRMLDVSVTISPIRSADGAIVGAVKTIRDISEQKASEVAIAELNVRLDRQTGLPRSRHERPYREALRSGCAC